MKNYTSTVAPEKSIMQIEQLLIKAKAQSIAKEYSPTGEISAISFLIKNQETGLLVGIRLPGDVDACYAVLKDMRKNSSWLSASQKTALREQAKRTAWRLMLDWVAVQMSMIEMCQAELTQVFMPYIWNGKATLYQTMKAANVPALGYAPQERKAGAVEDDEPA